MKKKGQVIFKGEKINYEIDENGYVWIERKFGKVNLNQRKPIKSTENIAEFIFKSLESGGY